MIEYRFTYLAVESSCPRADANEQGSTVNWHTTTEWKNPTQINPGMQEAHEAPLGRTDVCNKLGCMPGVLSKICNDCNVPYFMFHSMMVSNRKRRKTISIKNNFQVILIFFQTKNQESFKDTLINTISKTCIKWLLLKRCSLWAWLSFCNKYFAIVSYYLLSF